MSSPPYVSRSKAVARGHFTVSKNRKLMVSAMDNKLLSAEEMLRIKSHTEQWDSTPFNVKRCFDDRDALLAHIAALEAAIKVLTSTTETQEPL